MHQVHQKLDVLNDLMGQANQGIVSKKQGKGYLDKLEYAREMMKLRNLREKRGDFDQQTDSSSEESDKDI